MANAKFKTPIPKNEDIKNYAPGSPEKLELKAELKKQRENPMDIPLVIGGREFRSSDTSEVACPHNHNLKLGTRYNASEEDIDNAIKSSVEARQEWSNMPWEDRAAVFLKAGDLLATKYRPIMNAATMLGQSKTVFQSEIDAAVELIDFFRFNAKYMEELYEEQPISPFGMWNRTASRGLEGFVFAVTPFNFTSIGLNLPSAPALMGCSVIWKPARTSMLSSYIGLKLLEECGLPPGVINFISGSSSMISKKLLSSPHLAGIHFTGSTEVFNYMWHTIGENIDKYKTYPRIVGETGGKDFVFAHSSSDVQSLVSSLLRGSFEYQGQKCSASSRAYIPKSLWKEVKESLVAQTEEMKMGDVEDFTNFMGAVIDKSAYTRIKGYIDEAKADPKAEVIAGGQCDDSEGYFIRPTIIEAKDPSIRCMREEIFGPVLTIYVYDDNDLDAALKLCDEGSAYALTGAIFAKDRTVIKKMSDRLENAAGNFYINDKPTGAVVGQQPFGGARASGTNDKAGSKLNLIRWSSMRTMKENFLPVPSYKYPFMDEK